MRTTKPIIRCVAIMLITVTITGSLIFVSCKKDTDHGTSSTTTTPQSTTTPHEFELTDPPKIPTADIFMIQPSKECKDWRAGSVARGIQYYVTDMMDVLDSEKWDDDGKVPVNKDYHFSIYISRPISELDSYNIPKDDDAASTTKPVSTKAPGSTSATSAPTITSSDVTAETPEDEYVLIHYLINIETGTVNARFSSLDAFDTYATLDGIDLGMLKAYLKYYFGPQK